ncbi:MAG: hypothetical protein EOP05_22995 [Proteobacteria bacterium]|nr:MAG: hypothetical protein EOP05_22995 [Pseudomonadota bacterium]
MNFSPRSMAFSLLAPALALSTLLATSPSYAQRYQKPKAQTAACAPEVLQKMKGALAPDLLENQDKVVSLFDRAVSGEISCEQTTTPIEQNGGGSLAMCGIQEPEAYHDLKFAAGNNLITLRVLEVSVQCGGMGYWASDITSDRASVVQTTSLGKKKFALLRHKECSGVDELVAVRFKTETESGDKTTVTRVLSLTEGACEKAELTETILEL